MTNRLILTAALFLGCMTSTVWANFGTGLNIDDPLLSFDNTFLIEGDTLPPIEDRDENAIMNDGPANPFDLEDPPAITTDVTYDPETGYYIITEKIGDANYRPPTYMTFEEYMEWSAENEQNSYLQQLSQSFSLSGSSKKDPIEKYKEVIRSSLIDRLFGGNEVDIRPQGNIDLTFGVDYQNVENPILTERQRKQGGFDFDMAIQMNVIGKIGDKLNLGTNYNTQATFDFDNQMKLEYAGSEDEIIQKIEAGNVSLPLRSSLIQGSQSLFGIKTDLRFGRLSVSAIASQKKSKRENVQIQGGTQLQDFEIAADQYDENRHFFLSHYNRNDYERALENLPQINTLFKITKMEVWVTNTRNATEDVRDIVALMDLGEPNGDKVGNNTVNNPSFNPPSVPVHPVLGSTTIGLPANDANGLYDELNSSENANVRDLDNAVSTLQSSAFGLSQGEDFEKVRARILSSSEYTYHADLGYISLNLTLQPDEVLGVAYEYTYNGEVNQVGEFTNDLPTDADTLNVMFVKMLKSASQTTTLPIWDLMMKNVYSIGAYQVNPQDFKLDVFYQDPGGGFIRSLPEGPNAGRNIITLLNLDNLNSTGDPFADGQFDFVSGLTINPQNGRVIFPVLEPFGSSLVPVFTDRVTGVIDDAALAKYQYPQLYRNTITEAREFPEFNRFVLKGTYKSSVSSEISLGAFNIPRGSVTVNAGGQQLTEGVDYDVDYNIGRVKILNDAILNSGLPVNVSYEDNTLFGFQTKTMYGTRLDYEVSENFNIGGTFMHVSERPFTQKVNIGDDPISNSIYGLDIQYNKEAPWVTKFIDKLPLLQTKETSQISFTAEGAALRPGHAKALNSVDQSEDRGGTVYLDDFEGASSNFDLRTPTTAWLLASTPSDFQESQRINDLANGFNRAKMNWYRIDPTLRQEGNDPYVAQFSEQDIFPNRQDNQTGLQNIGLFTFDLAYNPSRRGPYNFDVDGMADDGTMVSGGIDPATGELLDPASRWGGIMRSLQTNDFQAANIEFVEFWVLSPFIDNAGGTGGNMYMNLGTVSEDVLRDSRKFFENGLPSPNAETRTDTTTWSRIPRVQAITNAFDNDPAIRDAQDLGLDGFDDEGEVEQYADYLDKLGIFAPNLVSEIEMDPANDNYLYHRDQSYGLIDDPNSTPTLQRYDRFNNPQGNSQGTDSDTQNNQGLNSSATNVPDTEDINRDNTLNEKEAYFEYKIPIMPDGTGGVTPSQFMVDEVEMQNGWKWYQYKIPVEEFTGKEGSIQDFRSIRFMRMYLTDFQAPVVMRFARLQLVRNQWRRYLRDLAGAGIGPITDPSDPTLFDVTAVNIEENSGSTPFPYVLPPGIERENSLGTYTNALQNEQSMALNVCNLKAGDARAVYKILNLDMRTYERLKMFVHAQSADLTEFEPGEISVFLRIGSDFENNYYEYEIPLLPSDTNALGTENYSIESQEAVWLEDNRFDFPLELMREVKKQRNADGSPTSDKYTITDPDDADNEVSVIGNPDLGYVKGVMIGLRNNTDADNVCAEVWLNELRLSGLDEKSGVAGLARLDVQMADFGNFTASANYSSIGFGGLEEKVQQRAMESVTQYDFATTLELGKFFPKNSGIRVPFYAQYSTTVESPEFDPYQLDLKLKEVLETTDPADRDSIRNAANDYTSIRGFNFTNVRKERTKQDRKPMPWDVENLSLTYAYDRTIKRDPTIRNDEIKRYRGSVDYSYASQLQPIAPFKKMKAKSKWLGLIREFNFNPIPNSINVRNDINRQFGEVSYRFGDPLNDTYFDKRFTWDRAYGLQWNLSKGLTMGFNAVNNAVIDERPEIELDDDGFPVLNADTGLPDRLSKEDRKEDIMTSFRDFGRNKHYNQGLNLSYTLPTKQIPLLDWTQIKAQYSSTYDWNRASLNVDSLGNTMQNSQTRQINADLDFTKLYNKSKYLKKINSKPKKNTKGGKDGRGGDTKGDRGGKVGLDGKGSKPDKKGGGRDKDIVKGGKDDGGKDSKGKGKGKSKGKGMDGAADGVLGKAAKVKKDREPTMIERIIIRPLMTVRKARLSFSENFSSVIPGYDDETRLFGQNNDFSRPGWDYVFGLRQPYFNTFGSGSSYAWLDKAAEEGWIVDNLFLNQQVLNNYTQTYDGKVTLEPFKDFRVDVDANRSFSKNHSEYFKVAEVDGEFEHLNAYDAGSLNMSYYTLRTMFRGTTTDDLAKTFKDFENNRPIISQRLAELDNRVGTDDTHPLDGVEYAEGYGRYQQDVLIPAFLAAYAGKDAASFPLKIANVLPRPNWRLTYNGLNKINMFKDLFSSVSISHSYTSTLGMNSFATDLDFQERLYNENTLNYYSTYEIPDLVINEQFAPLIGVDMRFKNDLTARFDWKKSRNLAMSFTDYQLSETNSEEYTIGIGYRVKGFKLPFKFSVGQGKDKKKTNELENDLNFKFDFSYRDDKTINHLLDQEQAVATRGSKIIRISPSIDYAVNKFVNVRLFFDRSRTIPATSASFPITNTQGGLTIRFSLAQ